MVDESSKVTQQLQTAGGKLDLVDIAVMAKTIDGLALEQTQKDRINARWLHYVRWWDRRATNAKFWFQWLQGSVVIGAALVPAFIALRELAYFGDRRDLFFSGGAILASLVVASLGGLERLNGWGDIWREKRGAAEVIKSEGFKYFALCGPYAQFSDHQKAYKSFADNVETIIVNEIHAYVGAIGNRPSHKP